MAQLWIYYALGASFFWGLGYVLSEKLLKEGLTPAFLMFIAAFITFPIYLALTAYMGDLKAGSSKLFSDWRLFSLTILMSLTIVGGNYLILMSVNEKNATLSALIEITYPIFTFILAWLILKEVQLNSGSLIGALLIFAGVTMIYIKS
jgi:drug/metabolite transporter (DMT)-like permease